MSLNTEYERTLGQLSTLSSLLANQSDDQPPGMASASVAQAGAHLKELTEQLRIQVEEQFTDFYTHIKRKQHSEIVDYGETVSLPDFLRTKGATGPTSTEGTLPAITKPSPTISLSKFGLGPTTQSRTATIATPRAPPTTSARDSLRSWIHIQLEGIMTITGATRGAVYIFVPGTGATTKSKSIMDAVPSTSSALPAERYMADYLLCVGAINSGGLIPTADIPVAAGTTMGAVVHHSVAANICGTTFAHDMDAAALKIFHSKETAELERAVQDVTEKRSSSLLNEVAAAQSKIRERYNTQLKVRNALIFPFGAPESMRGVGASGLQQEGTSRTGLRQALGCVLLADKPEPIHLPEVERGSAQANQAISARSRKSGGDGCGSSDMYSSSPVPPKGAAPLKSSGRLLQRAQAQNESSRAERVSSREEKWAKESKLANKDVPYALLVANAYNKAEKEKNPTVVTRRQRHQAASSSSGADSGVQSDATQSPRSGVMLPKAVVPFASSFLPVASPFEPLDETHLWCMTTLLLPVLQRYPSSCWVSGSPHIGTGLIDDTSSQRPGVALSGLSVVPPIDAFDPNPLYLKEVYNARLMLAATTAAAAASSSACSPRRVSNGSAISSMAQQPRSRRMSSNVGGGSAISLEDEAALMMPIDGPTAKAASQTALLIKHPPRQLQKTVVLRLCQGPTTLRSKDVNASLVRYNNSLGATTDEGPSSMEHQQQVPMDPEAIPTTTKGDIHHVLDRLHPVHPAGILSDPTDALLEAAPHVSAMEALWRKSLEHITELRSDLDRSDNTIRTKDRKIFDLEGEIKRMSQYFARIKADLTRIKKAVPEHLAAKFNIVEDAAEYGALVPVATATTDT